LAKPLLSGRSPVETTEASGPENKLERFYEQCFFSLVVDGSGGSVLLAPPRAALDVVFTNKSPPPPKSLQGDRKSKAAHSHLHGFDPIITPTRIPADSLNTDRCVGRISFAVTPCLERANG